MRESPRKLTLSTKLLFGKYKNSNKNIYDLIQEDISYIKWLVDIWEGPIDEKVTDMFNTFYNKYFEDLKNNIKSTSQVKLVHKGRKNWY